MTGLIILAAGASTRLGAPKQTLRYHGKSLLQHAVQAALGTACRPVIVVLGAHSGHITPELAGAPVQIVQHAGWEEGMGSSISAGVTALQEQAPQAAGVLLMLCDQPFVTAGLLNGLLAEKERSGKKIIASAYNNVTGPPVVFDAAFFAALRSLKGQQGAKALLQQYENEVGTLPFPQGATDIDTRDDYEALIKD
jgi:molybdenum cofactor cytidylyltransferase